MTERTRVVVTGAGGFIGQAIVRSLRTVREIEVQPMYRTRPETGIPIGEAVHIGDVRDLPSMRAAIHGADVVIHAASYIGYDPVQCHDTNVSGTANLAEAVDAEGVKKLVYVSTASVYGSGEHQGESEDETPIAPASPLSRSRADAERIVLENAGTVLRPDMVFGAGDRWFIPALTRFTEAIGGIVDGGSCLMSAIHVRDFAALVTRMALERDAPPGAFNAGYDRPTSVREITDRLGALNGRTAPLDSIEHDDARRRAKELGYTDRQFELLTTDHWYDNSKLRSVVGSLPGTFSMNAADRAWYRTANL